MFSVNINSSTPIKLLLQLKCLLSFHSANPHGDDATASILLLIITSFIMAVIASNSCFFIRASESSVSSEWWERLSDPQKGSLGFGLFRFQHKIEIIDDDFTDGYICTAWGSTIYDIFDGKWQAARVFGKLRNNDILSENLTILNSYLLHREQMS